MVQILMTALLSISAEYTCTQLSPQPSDFFERRVMIDADLDVQAQPKFVVLSGSTKVPLNQKAVYKGPDTVDLYDLFHMTSHDGILFGVSLAHAMSIGTPQGGMITYEPGRKGQFWNCRIQN
jgi:hypothetical protein